MGYDINNIIFIAYLRGGRRELLLPGERYDIQPRLKIKSVLKGAVANLGFFCVGGGKHTFFQIVLNTYL